MHAPVITYTFLKRVKGLFEFLVEIGGRLLIESIFGGLLKLDHHFGNVFQSNGGHLPILALLKKLQINVNGLLGLLVGIASLQLVFRSFFARSAKQEFVVGLSKLNLRILLRFVRCFLIY